MIRKSPEAYAAAAAIALLTALHKILYASVLVNDDFMHRAYACNFSAVNGQFATSSTMAWC